MRDLGLNPSLPNPWRTLYPLGQWADPHYLSKVSWQKLYLPKRKWILNETLVFFKIVLSHMGFNTLIPTCFHLVEAPLKDYIWNGVFLLMSSSSSSLILDINVPFKKQENVAWSLVKWRILNDSVFREKTFYSNSSKLSSYFLDIRTYWGVETKTFYYISFSNVHTSPFKF